MSKPRVMIATPTPGSVKTGFMKSVMAMRDDLAMRGIKSEFETEEGSDVASQRNILGSKFHSAKEFSHILLADSDMIFPSDLAARQLAADCDFITTVASRRSFDMDRMYQAMQSGADFKDAMLLATDWVAYPKTTDDKLEVVNGMTEFYTSGMAFTLLRRNVFETMIVKGAAKPQENPRDKPRGIINFFGAYAEAALNGQHVPEDHSFAYRWTAQCGGKIYALVDVTIFHIGDYGFGGSYFELIQAMGRAQERRGQQGFQPATATA